MPEIVQDIGSYAGLAAVAGLAVLSALYFSQARDVKRLREWAGRAPERAGEQAAQQAAAALRPAPSGAVRPVSAGTQPGAPAAKPAPAQAAATGAAPAVASAGPPAATPAAQKQEAAAEPAEEAPAEPAEKAPAGAPAGDGAAEPETKPEAAPEVEPAVAASADTAEAEKEPEKEKEPVAAAATAAAGASASGATAAPEAPAGPGEPEAPPVPPTPGPSLPRFPSRAEGPRPSPAQTAILPPYGEARAEPWHRRLLVSPRYLVLAIAGVLIVGGAAIFGVSELAKEEAPPPRETAVGGEEESERGQGRRAPPVNPANVTVSVLNGTTVPGLAAQLGDKIEGYGFQLGNVTNSTDQQKQESVVLFSPGHEREAIAVGRRLGVSQRERIDAESQALGGDAAVVVIAGADQTR